MKNQVRETLEKLKWLNFVVLFIAGCIYSLGAWLITDVLPIDVSMASPLAGNDLLLCAQLSMP